MVKLARGEFADFAVEVVADAPGGVAGDAGGPAVGDDVAEPGDEGAEGHRDSPEQDGAAAPRRDDLVEQMREDPG